MTKMIKVAKGSSNMHLQSALWTYRTAFKVTTKQMPFHLAFGQEAIVPFEFKIPALRTSVEYELNPEANLQERLTELERMDEQHERLCGNRKWLRDE